MGCVHSQHGWLVSAQCCLNSLRSLMNRRVFRPYDFGRVTVLTAPQHLDTLVARYFQFYHTEEVECTMLLLSGSCPFSSWPSSTSCDLPSQTRSEEHTSELQSRGHLVCRLLLEKKKKEIIIVKEHNDSENVLKITLTIS